jgi:membrane protease YdiL (CAAX protease family)
LAAGPGGTDDGARRGAQGKAGLRGQSAQDPGVTNAAAAPLHAPRGPIGRQIAAVLALVLTVAIAWMALVFGPGLADRAIPLSTLISGEDGAALLTFGALIVGALLLAAVLRQRMMLGLNARWLSAGALPAGALGVSAATGLSALAGAAAFAPDPAWAGAGTLMIGSLVVLWAAFAEELLFRCVLQPVLARAWGIGAGLVLTATAFTLTHYLGGWRDPVSLLNIFLAGWWFGVLAWRCGGLLAPTLAHFGWNGAEALILGASPNPGVGSHGSVTDIDLFGPAILGGSSEGLNASLTATIILVFLAVACGWRWRTGSDRETVILRAGQ